MFCPCSKAAGHGVCVDGGDFLRATARIWAAACSVLCGRRRNDNERHALRKMLSFNLIELQILVYAMPAEETKLENLLPKIASLDLQVTATHVQVCATAAH